MAISAELQRKLKARAHSLPVLIQTGNKGITDAVVAEIDSTIEHHELIKVRLAGSEREGRDEMAALLAKKTRSEIVGMVGAVVILYRRTRKKKK